MVERKEEARRRRWADMIVLAIGAYAWVTAFFTAGFVQPGGVTPHIPFMLWYWGGTALAGALAIGAVLVALRSTLIARIMTALAGLGLISVLLAFDVLNVRSILLFGVPGLVLLALTPFVGPMPSPEEEGRPR